MGALGRCGRGLALGLGAAQRSNGLGGGQKGCELGHIGLAHITRPGLQHRVQAAIGQANTMVTPVQLATYAATIANKGVRYRTHMVAGFRDTNTG